MNINWNKKYTTIAMYSLIVIGCSIILYMTIAQVDKFTGMIQDVFATLNPFIIGLILAYILNFVMVFIEKNFLNKDIFNKISSRIKRLVSILITYVFTLTIIYLFIRYVLPQLINSLIGIANNIPQYVQTGTEFTNKIIQKINVQQQYIDIIVKQFNEYINSIIKFITGMAPIIANLVVQITSSIVNIIIGIALSIYLLIDKEKFIAISRKMIYAIFRRDIGEKILELSHKSNYIFSRFLVGKILNSIIVGLLTFIVLVICRIPYAVLISIIIGVTNIIPFFGPFFGAIPSTIILLLISPTKALWFVIIIIIIQQIDGNIITPKMLGETIGISAFWVVFSLLIFSKLFGFIGLLLGVPIFAVIYSIIKELVEANLKKRGLPIETNNYKK